MAAGAGICACMQAPLLVFAPSAESAISCRQLAVIANQAMCVSGLRTGVGMAMTPP